MNARRPVLMNLNEKDKRALVICGVFLGVVGLYMGLIDPLVLRYESARAGIAEAEKKLARLRRGKRLLRPRQRKLRDVRAHVEKLLSTFGSRVESGRRLGACIHDFQQAAADAGAVLHSIRPLPLPGDADPDFDAYRFELDFSGSYRTIMRMLYNLEAGGHLHRTLQLDLKLEKGAVCCRMLAERYYYDPAPAAQTAAAARGRRDDG